MNTHTIAIVIGWLARITGGFMWLGTLGFIIAEISKGGHPPFEALLVFSLIIVGYPLAWRRPIWGGVMISIPILAFIVIMIVTEYRDYGRLPSFSRKTIYAYLTFSIVLIPGLLFIAQGLIRRVHRRMTPKEALPH